MEAPYADIAGENRALDKESTTRLEFHAIVAKSPAMPSPWRFALIPAIAVAALFAGGTLVAQMESGDRVILPIDSSGTLEIGGIKVDVAGKDAAEARFAGWRVAQREGFKALWAKTNKRQDDSNGPLRREASGAA